MLTDRHDKIIYRYYITHVSINRLRFSWTDNPQSSKVVTQLAKDLGLEQTASAVQNRPLSGMIPEMTSPPPSPTHRKKGTKIQTERKNKKKLSKLPSGFPIARLIKHKYKEKRSVTEDSDGSKPMSTSPPHFPRPKIPPPALPAEFRVSTYDLTFFFHCIP